MMSFKLVKYANLVYGQDIFLIYMKIDDFPDDDAEVDDNDDSEDTLH